MITVLGASGFIGSHLVKKLRETGVQYFAPGRDEVLQQPLGNIIYCIGLTADFRSYPNETVEAHVGKLLQVVRECEFESLLYVSSTRVYGNQGALATEDDLLHVNSANPSDLYNISKLMGEALTNVSEKKGRVVRLSNVYGDDFTSQNFLSTLIRDAVTKKTVTVHTSPDSEKDYVSVHDVVAGLIKLATRSRQSVYNLASGVNVSNRQITERLSQLTGCDVSFEPAGPTVRFPPISIDRVRGEFDFQPSSLLDDMATLVDSYRNHYGDRND
jgi:nucleoside-diphosphate-sugar epimerase